MKQKTHKGMKKAFKVRPGGTISMGCPGGRHNTGKKNRDLNRKNRKGSLMDKSDQKRLKNVKF